MDSIKKIGDVCKQHYEKLLLIVALVMLGVAVLYLYMESESEKEKIKEFFTDVGRKKTSFVAAADLTNFQAALTTSQNPPPLELGSPHNLFNPVKWKQTAQGGFIKEVTGTESSLGRLDILEIRPLNFIVAFDRVAGPGYWINITNEVLAANAPGRRIAQFAGTLNATNTKVFILREIKGPQPPEEPTELVLELKETNERISIAKDKPYVRPIAYEADLRFNIDNKVFSRQRAGAVLRLGDEDYKIITINQNEIGLMAPNDKRYTKPFKPENKAAVPAAAPAQ